MMNDPISAGKLIAIIAACLLLVSAAAWAVFKWGVAKSITILENAVTKKELNDVLAGAGFVTHQDLKDAMSGLVTMDKLQIAQFQIQERFNSELTQTRHDLRNEFNAGITKLQDKLESLTKEMDSRVLLITQTTDKQIAAMTSAIMQCIKEQR